MEKLKLKDHNKREVQALKLLVSKDKTSDFIEKYGQDISDVIESNPCITQPEELAHLIKLRIGDLK